jgi:hypothetical protein
MDVSLKEIFDSVMPSGHRVAKAPAAWTPGLPGLPGLPDSLALCRLAGQLPPASLPEVVH